MTTLTVKAGKNHDLKLVYKDNNDQIINITGASSRLMVRKSHYAAPVITKTATITGAAGEILFAFLPADTNTLLTTQWEETYLYDVELTLATGEILPLIEGKFVVQQPITRD